MFFKKAVIVQLTFLITVKDHFCHIYSSQPTSVLIENTSILKRSE